MNLIERLAKASTARPVTIGEDTFHIRVMSGSERDEWEQFVSDLPDGGGGRSKTYAELLVRTLADNESGARALADGDAAALRGQVSFKVLKRLFDEAFALNRIGEDGVAAEKKDLPADQTSNSGSSSPAPLA